MKKTELEDILAQFSIFISNIYASGGLEMPSDGAEWDAEQESMICYNAIKAVGRREVLNALVAAEKDMQEKERLLKHIENCKDGVYVPPQL